MVPGPPHPCWDPRAGSYQSLAAGGPPTATDRLLVTLQTHTPHQKIHGRGDPHEEEVRIPGKAQSGSKRQLEPGWSDAFTHQKPCVLPQGRRAAGQGPGPGVGPAGVGGNRALPAHQVGRPARNGRDVSGGGCGVFAGVGGVTLLASAAGGTWGRLEAPVHSLHSKCG